MKLIKYCILILLWFPVITYSQFKELEKNSFIKQIIGKWNWASTYGGWGGTITPGDVGYNKSFVLFQDSVDQASDSISYLVYINETLTDSGTAFISLSGPAFCSSDSTWSINAKILGDSNTAYLGSYDLLLYNKSIFICEYCYDCYNHTYLKDSTYPVYIIDKMFLYALIREGVDANADSLISYAEAEAITTLNVSSRNISDLTGIEAFTNLNALNCSDNEISILDMSINHKISVLECPGNHLTSLILSKFKSPSLLNCSNNMLTGLYLPGKPDSTEYSDFILYLRNMPSLQYVCMWEMPSSDPRIITDTSGSPYVYFTNECADHIVNIPDTIFLNALIGEGVDTNGDGLISISEAVVKNGLNLNEKNITDLTGIEAFTNLASLYCAHNYLTNLDVSSCKNLGSLYCEDNQLTSLDVSNNSMLINLNCSDNKITSLDLSNCTSLERLSCNGNQLTNLDISKNTALENISLKYSPNLFQVCVWVIPFNPPGVRISLTGSPNLYFTTECTIGTERRSPLSETLLIYPNPFSEYTVLILSDSIRPIKIELIDLYGRIVKTINNLSGNSITIYRENLPGGIYFLKIYSDDISLNKVIIQ